MGVEETNDGARSALSDYNPAREEPISIEIPEESPRKRTYKEMGFPTDTVA